MLYLIKERLQTEAMLKKNFTMELITEITDISQEEIRALSPQMADDKH